MTDPTILLDSSAGITRLVLNRPEQMNSFNAAMHEKLRDALNFVEETLDRHRVLIITGAGQAFCAGQDLNERARMLAEGGVDLGSSIAEWYAPLVLKLRRLPIPVIAAVNGVAAGAGSSLALACDLVIAAQTATFIQSFGKVGLIPDCGGTWFLPRTVGRAKAFGLAMLADRITAEEAERLGLIWRCVPDDEHARVVEDTAAQLACASPRALTSLKRAFDLTVSNTLEEQLLLEAHLQRELGRTDDYREGIRAFSEKRAARFSGR